MIVYRVEAPTGYGPYSLWTNWQTVAHDDKSGRPEPYADPVMRKGWHLRGQGDWRFGFESMEKLRMWFDENELANLRDHSCRVVCYEVPEHRVIMGEIQLCFDKKQATLLEAHGDHYAINAS